MLLQQNLSSHFRRVASGCFIWSCCYSIALRAFRSVYLHKQILERGTLFQPDLLCA